MHLHMSILFLHMCQTKLEGEDMTSSIKNLVGWLNFPTAINKDISISLALNLKRVNCRGKSGDDVNFFLPLKSFQHDSGE